MAREAIDVCLPVLKESKKSRFDSCSVRNIILIISRISFRDCRAHIFPDNLSRNRCIIISYPTSASGIIVLLKTPTKYPKFFPTLFVQPICTNLICTTHFQLVFNFEQTRTVTIFGEHGMMAHIP